MRAIITAAAMAILSGALAACSSDSTTSPVAVTGTYVLVAVNGVALPHAFLPGGVDVFTTLVADTVVINAPNTYGEHERTSVTIGVTGPTRLDSAFITGTYVRTGHSLTFTATTGDVAGIIAAHAGNLTEGTLTLTDGDTTTYEYQRL